MATPEVIFTISIIVIPYYSSQTIVLFLLSPSQLSGGQKRWPSQMGAATLTQLSPAIILTSYLTVLATQRWKLSIKTFKKILQNTIANRISIFFTVEELGLRWFCWQQWRTLSEGHERAHWSKSLCKIIVIVNRFNDHTKNQISIANGKFYNRTMLVPVQLGLNKF